MSNGRKGGGTREVGPLCLIQGTHTGKREPVRHRHEVFAKWWTITIRVTGARGEDMPVELFSNVVFRSRRDITEDHLVSGVDGEESNQETR